MTIEVARFEIAKLQLDKGDTLVVKTDQVLAREQVARIRETLAEFVPDGVKVMMLSAGLTIEVLKHAEAEPPPRPEPSVPFTR